jgi:hypothetical protein
LQIIVQDLISPAHANKFRLGDLHRLGNAIAADRLDIIRDQATNIQERLRVSAGAV